MASPAQDDTAQNRRSDVQQVMTAQVDAGPAETSLEGETHGPQYAGSCNGTSGGREAVGTEREGRAGPRGTPSIGGLSARSAVWIHLWDNGLSSGFGEWRNGSDSWWCKAR